MIRRYPKGLTRHRLYGIWMGMKCRCKPGNVASKYYGDRGIVVCDEWKDDYMAFYAWAMEHGYEDKLSIDRIDNNGNYEPLNCRFADSLTQVRNRRNYKGVPRPKPKHNKPAHEPYPFLRGYNSLRRKDIFVVKKELMCALKITSDVAFSSRLNGKVIPRVTEAEIIEGIFAKYGVIEVWGR